MPPFKQYMWGNIARRGIGQSNFVRYAADVISHHIVFTIVWKYTIDTNSCIVSSTRIVKKVWLSFFSPFSIFLTYVLYIKMQNANLSILFYLSMYNFEVVLYFKIKIRFYRSEPSDVKYVQPTSTLVSKVATTGSGRALKVPATISCLAKHLASTIPKCTKLI